MTAAVRAKNVSLLLRPEAALFAQPTADITAAITTELDRLVPSVSTAVPANWQPNQNGQQQGAAPHARRGQGRFGPRMASTDHDDVKLLRIDHG